MAQVPINNYFNTPGGNGNATIITDPKPHASVSSSTGEDGGTVAGLARLWNGGISKHSSINELVDNLKNHRTGTIVGHGSPGMFEVGDGPMWRSDLGHISLYNQEAWVEKFKDMWRKEEIWYSGNGAAHPFYSPIRILACSVAGDNEGIQLMQKMADITNRMFEAYSGLIYYVYDLRTGKGLRTLYEKGHNHIKVYPSGTLVNKSKNTLNANVHSKFRNVGNMKSIGFDSGMETQDVVSIEINFLLYNTYVNQNFPPEFAEKIFATIFYTLPFSKCGASPGIITAQLTINYKSQSPLQFNIYSDKLAESTTTGESFLTSPQFREVISDLFK